MTKGSERRLREFRLRRDLKDEKRITRRPHFVPELQFPLFYIELESILRKLNRNRRSWN